MAFDKAIAMNRRHGISPWLECTCSCEAYDDMTCRNKKYN